MNEKKSNITLYMDKGLADYNMGRGHPMTVPRFQTFSKVVHAQGWDTQHTIKTGRTATVDELKLFHTPEYIDRIKTLCDKGTGYLDHGDTPAVKGLFEAASRVVGTVLTATEELTEDVGKIAFVPIGGFHHAKPDEASGFCVFNDVCIAMERLWQHAPMARIFYAALDAYFGDGVYYPYADDPRLGTFDWHQEHIFPGTGFENETGIGPSAGHKCNVPLPAGLGDDDMEPHWMTFEDCLEQERPHYIILQTGVDAMRGDPLCQMNLTAQSYVRAGRTIKDYMENHKVNGVLVLGGGGLNPDNIRAGWTAVIQGLSEPGRKAQHYVLAL